MRKMGALFICVLVLCAFFASCDRSVIPDTPQKAAWLTKVAIGDQDYEKFNDLFREGRKDSIPFNDFKALQSKVTGGSSYTHYVLVTMENGQMLLVRETLEKENGKYLLENVKMVPDEMKKLFGE